MRIFHLSYLVILFGISLCCTASNLFADDEKPTQLIGQFVDRAYVEVTKSKDALDISDDFTIELLARWQPAQRYEYFAGNEAWPDMSDSIKVQNNCGWVLRKIFKEKAEMIDFTFGTKETGWFSIRGPFARNSEWVHIVVSRFNDNIAIIVNGQLAATQSVKGLTYLPCPTEIYLGPRKHSTDRQLNSSMAFFRMANKAHFRKVPFKAKLPKKPDEEDLVYYDFKQSKRDTLIDLSGNDRHGILSKVVLVPSE